MRLTILGPPRTKKNHQRIIRVKGRPVIMQAKTSEGWEKSAVAQLQIQWNHRSPMVIRGDHEESKKRPVPRDGPLSLRALVYRDRKVGDLGNYLAAVCDALERAGVVENDRLIQSFDGSRLLVDKARPRVEIEITPFEETT